MMCAQGDGRVARGSLCHRHVASWPVGLVRQGEESCCERGATDAELAVDVRQMGFDRAHTHVQLSGDLPVGTAFGAKRGHLLFVGR